MYPHVKTHAGGCNLFFAWDVIFLPFHEPRNASHARPSTLLVGYTKSVSSLNFTTDSFTIKSIVPPKEDDVLPSKTQSTPT